MRLYHLSEQNIGHMVPRIPESDYDDQMTPRICFSKSVQGCLIGINENKDITGKVFHVYTLDTDNFYEPDESQVPDVKVTQEVWIEFECDPKYQGDIQVIAEKGTYKSEIDGGSFEVPVWEWEQIDGNDEIKEDFSELEMLDSYVPHKNIITEASRNQILSKSKSGDHYANGGSRWTQKNKCSVTNSVQDYNKIDMDTFWKKDVLSFVVKVRGETDTYNVTIEFNNVLRNLQNRVKGSKNKFDRDNVFSVLMSAINNSNDVKFSCTCPDFKYRMAYHASKNGYKAGEKETRASNVTNANDTKGAACKHVLFCLNNAICLRNVASVIVNYTNYCKDNMEYNYGKYMFPKIYGQQYEKVAQIIAQNEADERLKSDEALINLANALGKIRGRFKKGSNKNPATQQNQQNNKNDEAENDDSFKESLDEVFDIPRDLDNHFNKHCAASQNFSHKGIEDDDKAPFSTSEVKNKEDYKAFAEWFASQPIMSNPKPHNGIIFKDDVKQLPPSDEILKDGTVSTVYTKYCKINQKYNHPGNFRNNQDLYLIVIYFISKNGKIGIKTFYKGCERTINMKSAKQSGIDLRQYGRSGKNFYKKRKFY